MYMQTITQIMMEEHNNILPVVDALEEKARVLRNTREIDVTFFMNFLEFQRGYTDGIHHAKEEEILFPALTEHESTKDNSDIKLLVHQHILSRAHMENIEEAISTGKHLIIVNNALEYCSMIRDHIEREDTKLFPLVEKLMPADMKQKVLNSFSNSEESVPKGMKEKLLKLAKGLIDPM